MSQNVILHSEHCTTGILLIPCQIMGVLSYHLPCVRRLPVAMVGATCVSYFDKQYAIRIPFSSSVTLCTKSFPTVAKYLKRSSKASASISLIVYPPSFRVLRINLSIGLRAFHMSCCRSVYTARYLHRSYRLPCSLIQFSAASSALPATMQHGHTTSTLITATVTRITITLLINMVLLLRRRIQFYLPSLLD